jgi:hypothetical protein
MLQVSIFDTKYARELPLMCKALAVVIRHYVYGERMWFGGLFRAFIRPSRALV